MLTPYAAACKSWSRAIELAARPERAFSPDYLMDDLSNTMSAAASMNSDWTKFAVDTARWLAELEYPGRR